MLPEDVGSALVAITGENGGPVAGAGFLCYHGTDRSLILTASQVLGFASSLNADSTLSSPTVWINGKWEAKTVFGALPPISSDLAVLECSAAELRRCNILPLSNGPIVGDAEIVSFQQLQLVGEKRRPARPLRMAYRQRAEDEHELTLHNHLRFPIRPEHCGSPVLGENGVVGVVTRLVHASSGLPDMDTSIVATLVEYLSREWPEMPPDLFAERQDSRPLIFFSYAHKDGDLVRLVKDGLVENGYDVWRDKESLVPGLSFVRGISQGLESSDVILLFVSPAYLESPWANQELDVAVNRKLSRENPATVIAVMLAGVDALPGMLQGDHAIDLRKEDVARALTELINAIPRRRSVTMRAGA